MPAPPMDAAAARSQADEWLNQVEASLGRYETISAKISQKVNLFEQQLTGTGTFLKGPRMQMRLELKLFFEHGQPPSSLTQVCDGRWLWEHREVLGSRQLRKVDVQRVLDALAQSNRPGDVLRTQRQAFQTNIGLGGMTQLIQKLRQHFEFRAAPNEAGGNDSRLAMVGTWRKEWLVQLFPDQKASLEAGGALNWQLVPVGIPDQVVLLVGSQDFFPYHIEYRRTAANLPREKNQPVPTANRLLVSWDLHDVEVNKPIDELNFFYKSENTEIDDTNKYLQENGLAK